MNSEPIRLRFTTDGVDRIEQIIRTYYILQKPAENATISNESGQKDSNTSRISSFLLDLGVLEQVTGRKLLKQLSPLGKQLGYALNENDEQETQKCWQQIITASDSALAMLKRIRRYQPLEHSQLTELIDLIINESDQGLARKKKSPKNLRLASRVVFQLLVTNAGVVEVNPRGKYVVSKIILSKQSKRNTLAVTRPSLRITSEIVERAINDAEILIRQSDPTSAVDRTHTALHGYLKTICDNKSISYAKDASLTELFKILRDNHSALQMGSSSNELAQILKAFSSVLDALNHLRNRASIAHPNPHLLGQVEAMLAINAARTILHYIDAKIS